MTVCQLITDHYSAQFDPGHRLRHADNIIIQALLRDGHSYTLTQY